MKGRPKRITVLVVVFGLLAVPQFIGAAMMLAMTLGLAEMPNAHGLNDPTGNLRAVSSAMEASTPLSATYGIISNLVWITCLVGFWRMRRWAVLLFAALSVTGLFLAFIVKAPWAAANPQQPWPALILAIIVWTILLSSWNRMEPMGNNAETKERA